jgi:DNA-binding response OmpR family regulator
MHSSSPSTAPQQPVGFEERPSGTFPVRRDRPVTGNVRPAAVLEWGPFRVDLLAQRVWVAGNEIFDLEPLQVRLLGCLIERAGAMWHRDELCARLYGEGSVNSRALSRAIWGLRQHCGEASQLIVSLRAVGYGLSVRIPADLGTASGAT